MSKFRTRIRDIGRPTSGGLGFAAVTGRDDRRHVMVLAEVASAEAARAAIEAGADVLLASTPGAVAGCIEAAGGHPVGARLASGTAADGRAAAEAGADFLLFDDATTEARALTGHDAGRVLVLGDERTEERLRTVAGLSLDAVLVGEASASMTVRDQLTLRRVGELTGAPLIVAAAQPPGAEALEAWRDAGAPIVLVPGDDASVVGAAVEAARQVPAPRRRTESRAMPLVPAASGHSHDHDDDDDFARGAQAAPRPPSYNRP